MKEFSKDEKLCSNKLIKELFAGGYSFKQYPFIITLKKESLNSVKPVKILIHVSKKRFNKAVDRNLIKRIIKEAYRLNKKSFYENLKNKEIEIILSLSYISNEILSLKEMQYKIDTVFNKIIDNLIQKKV
jgi:ribonuclease P protein component